MQLNISTDYAIRALLYLSTCDCPTSARDIAEAMEIPQSYLVTILTKLKKNNYINVLRGSAGGCCLAKKAEDITLLDIIETMEGSTRINRCLEQDCYCSRNAADSCPVRSTYCTIQQTVEEMLRNVTLQSLRGQM